MPFDVMTEAEALLLEEAFCYTISFHGETLPMALVEENVGFDGWQTGRNEEDGSVTHTATWTRSCYAYVPIGYDGVVVGLSDSGAKWTDDMYIHDVEDEHLLLFRLDDQALNAVKE